jgi:quercetin dioxygenase-like cupin family protein
MSASVSNYSIDTNEVFESIIKEDQFEFNHVIIKPHFFFSAHPADANVTITVVNGDLWLTIAQGSQQIYKKGSVIHVGVGTMSKLGNDSEYPCELFVIKRR